MSIKYLFTSHLKLTCQSIFFNMERLEYRAVIRFFVLIGLKAKEIYKQLLEVYKEFSTSKRTVDFWAGQFRRGRIRHEDESCQNWTTKNHNHTRNH